MSRTIEVSLPSERTDNLIKKVEKINGLIGLRVQRNISVHPKGDVVSFDLLNDEVTNFLRLMEQEGLLEHENVSLTSSRPTSIISKSHSDQIVSESHETSWEDMLKDLLHESNMTFNTQLVMLLAGLMAAIGISNNSLHIVVGAMLIAPGFEPVARLSMGLVTRHRDWKNGAIDIIKGYGLLIVGGILGALVIQLLGKDVVPGSSSYLPKGVLVQYWSSITAASVIVSIFASLAGGIIIMTNKSLLTAGVMVALALIPSAALVGMALVEGNMNMAGTTLIRLLLEIGIVGFFTGVIFQWKKFTTHKRKMRV